MNRFLNFLIILVVALLLSFQQAEGQIWKKIKQKTKQKVENTVSEKASDKAAEIAANSMDKMLNADINPFEKGAKEKDKSDLPDSYSFDWKYALAVNSSKSDKTTEMDFYLSTNKPYFGYRLPQMASMFTVIDVGHGAMISYMERNGQPVAKAFSLPREEDETDGQKQGKFTVTKLPERKMLGFSATGMQLENAHSRLIVYSTTEAGVSFIGAFTSSKNKLPAETKNYIGKSRNGLILYLKYYDKNDPQNNVLMKGKSLEEAFLIKSNSNYTFMK